VRQVVTQLQPHQGIANELAGSQPTALLIGQFPRPAPQLRRHHLWFSVLVSRALGQHVPDGDQQAPGDGHHGFVLVHPAR
jgi:hypothetical protein